MSLDAYTDADFEQLAQLAEKIWHLHYAKIISAAQIEYMLAERYTPQKLGAYLNADNRWLKLLRIDGKLVGYCSCALTEMRGEMKIEQLYLLQELRGKGLGKLMLQHMEDQAAALGLSRLMLQVNKHNFVALDFYHQAGFVLREEMVFDIGHGFVMDDYVMQKTL
jgi:ribosomal protein S18 acetylase RimI-like enzyme